MAVPVTSDHITGARRVRPSDGGAARKYVGLVLTSTARDLFTALAASAATLTGLLFVARSVAPGRTAKGRPPIVQQLQTAAALLSFMNGLAVSLFGLVPGNNVGYPAVAVAVIGLFFSAAALRSLVSAPEAKNYRRRQVALFAALLTLFGFEVGAGLDLLLHPRSTASIDLIGNLLVASLVIGVERAWELVGDRDTGILASIAVLAGREDQPAPPSPTAAEPSAIDAAVPADRTRPGTGTAE